MNLIVVSQLLLLLLVANGAPLIAKNALGDFLAKPIDGGLKLFDGRPLFGSSKTIRGIVAAVLFTAAFAPLIALTVGIGALVGATAMAGDLLSSFSKRRLGLPASSRAFFLDQIPESLIPALVCQRILGIGPAEVLAVPLAFLVCELILTRLFSILRIRDYPTP